MDQYSRQTAGGHREYRAPFEFREVRNDNPGTRSAVPAGRFLRIDSPERHSLSAPAKIRKIFTLAFIIVIYAFYMYIVWKINTGQGDSMKNATYWKRWGYLKGSEAAHKIAYRADRFDMSCRDNYRTLTEKTYLGG